jgi:hypothetical protein
MIIQQQLYQKERTQPDSYRDFPKAQNVLEIIDDENVRSIN